jgi:hypothetical protein
LAGVDTRSRKERRGRRIAQARAREGGREGKEKGGHGGNGAPIIGNTMRVGDRPRVVPHGSEVWGCGSSTAGGWRGVVGSGPTVALAGGT